MGSAVTDQAMKRLNLALPDRLFNELQTIADEQGTTVTELLRRFIKLGLFAVKFQGEPGEGLFIKEQGQETKVYLM